MQPSSTADLWSMPAAPAVVAFAAVQRLPAVSAAAAFALFPEVVSQLLLLEPAWLLPPHAPSPDAAAAHAVVAAAVVPDVVVAADLAVVAAAVELFLTAWPLLPQQLP